MNEYAFIFRMDITASPNEAQLKQYMKQWGAWIESIRAQSQLAGGNHFSIEGRVLRANGKITNRPYTEKKESVAGYILVRANDFNEAVKLAEKCPILQGEGTSVEIRELATPN